MILYDLVNDKNQQVFDLVRSEMDEFYKTDHLLKSNYVNILDSIDDYDCFTVLIHEGNLVGFSGLYNNNTFPSNIARVLNRAYYARKFRTRSLFRRSNNSMSAFGSYYMLPYQIKIAQSFGYDSVFISIENYHRRNNLKAQIKLSNQITGFDFQVLPGLYNTCRLINNQQINYDICCWQNVAYMPLKDNASFPLPNISETEWIRFYGNNDYYRNK